MTSGVMGAENFCRLEDILFAQYFARRAHALHFVQLRTEETIGRPGSHGHLNRLSEDARLFWDWTTVGAPLYLHP